MARITLFSLLFASLWGLSALAMADSVELSGGGQVTGVVTRTARFVLVQVDDEIQVAIPNSRVLRVVESDDLAQYRAYAAKAGDDPELHYKLAIWCVTGNNIPGESKYYKQFHMRRAVELNPDHANARVSLGYKKHEGKWVLKSELMRRRGMTTKAGRMALPEAVALEESQSAFEVESKKWIREIKLLLKAVRGRDADRKQEAMAQIQAIQDPVAAAAIAGQLDESRNNRSQSTSLRRLWVTLLGRFRNSTSIAALVKAGIDETDAVIREAALDELVKFGSSSAVATYLPMLKSNNNELVNRAARALSWFPDPELALTYVDALTTIHKKTQGAGPGIQAGFGDNGANGLAMGNKPTVRKYPMTNPAVLGLMKQIEPDVDFGYDEKKWRAYYSQQRNRFSGDLRRDP